MTRNKEPHVTAGVAMAGAEMYRRGMTRKELAALCETSESSIGQWFAAGFPSPQQRHRVEKALDMAIWSPPDEMRDRRLCLKLFGADPRCVSHDDLILLCKRIPGFRPPSYDRSLESYFQAIRAWLAANPRAGRQQAAQNFSGVQLQNHQKEQL